MSNNSTYSKADFIRLVNSSVENDSSDKEKAKEYLSSQGLNVDSIVSDGLKRIKRMQLKIQAEKTKHEMQSYEVESARIEANEWVEKLLSKIDFSFAEIVKEEGLVINFKSLDKLTKDDIKSLLTKHFTLKFLKEKKSNGI